jgi:hypothetical protein
MRNLFNTLAGCLRAYTSATRAFAKAFYSSEMVSSISGFVTEAADAFAASDLPSAIQDIAKADEEQKEAATGFVKSLKPSIKRAASVFKSALGGSNGKTKKPVEDQLQ